MRTRGYDAVLVLASWALVAVPALMLLSGRTQMIERWLVLATLVPVLGLLARYFSLSHLLGQREGSLADSRTELELAEELAGMGRWSIDASTREHRWSEEVCRIVGVAPGTPANEFVVARILAQGGSQIEATIASHQRDTEPYTIEFEIDHLQLGPRMLRARARNDFDPAGELAQIFMVVRDVTEDYALVRAIEREKQAALEQAQEAMHMANTDPLTGLANRRQAMAALDRAVLAARNDGEPLSVIVFDLDHFKQINDTYGHRKGDEALQAVARIARAQARGPDTVARIGGEEFLWVIPGADQKNAQDAAERLRLAIELGTRSGPQPQVTASVGQATHMVGEAGLMLFARADEALYAAKRAGRNRIALAA